MAVTSPARLKDESLADMRARIGPPSGYEDPVVTRIGEHLVWAVFEDLQDDAPVLLYEGDCRNVLLPDDPRLKA